MILIVNLCKEKLSYYEFVKPIEEIIKENYFVKKYDEVFEKDLEKADKIILSGTSLFDNEFLNDIEKFSWIKKINKPVLGICAGFQVIQAVYNGKIENIKEIGPIKINFKKDFFGFLGEKEVYSLHQNFCLSNDFQVYADSQKCVHALKHKSKDIYAVLFHPEVYNKELIKRFISI